VVADKPHFLPVKPGGRFIKQSLLVRLKQALGLPELSPVHRIDRETSGLVLFSVRSGDRSRYQTLFEQRQVHKTCEAVAPLSADPLPPSYQSRIVQDGQFFRQREAAGETSSLTRILGVTPLPCNNTPARGLYLLQPVTGKTHQLRVHLNALGRPIVKDLCCPAVVQGPGQAADYSRPLQLCARSLAFADPVTGQEREFISQRVLTSMSALADPSA
jgi:tRNA pseudouridine32 synthase/23S rRNA pseudouridine746 synthase